jgi:hypothetical protein
VAISDNASYTALTHIDLIKLGTGITTAMLAGATVTGGKILISASSNTAIYNLILANFDSCDDVDFNHD